MTDSSNSLPSVLISLKGDPSRHRRFKPGQPLTTDTALPNQVLLILEGQARLLTRERDQPATLRKLSTGDVVGLASLISAAPCETVHASTNLKAAILPDQELVKLLDNTPEFLEWSLNQLWDAELARLLKPLRDSSAEDLPTLASQLDSVRDQARLLSQDPVTVQQALEENQRVFVASANSDLPLGQEITDGNQISLEIRPPLPLRLIALPAAAVDALLTPAAHLESSKSTSLGTAKSHIPESSALAVIEPAQAGLPLATTAGFGQKDPRAGLQLIRAEGEAEELMACMQMLAQLMGLKLRRDAIERVLNDAVTRGQGINLQLIGQLSTMLGLHAVGGRMQPDQAQQLQTPSIVRIGTSTALAIASNEAGLLLASPSQGWREVSVEELAELAPEGFDVALVERTSATQEQRFGPSWFLPAIKRHRSALIQVLAASFVVQLFTLANPLLIQVIIDKVISQRSLDTLQVLGMALIAVTLFEGVLNSLKTFLFQQTTNRIDMRLGSEVIDHLLRLPLGYFDRRPVGELSTRIGELEKIRNFLTGQALTTVLDGAFSVIYIGVMCLYSWQLTIVALLVVPIQITFTILGAPLFRKQFRNAAKENAKTQSHLVEVLTGIQTVKAQNVEMVSRWKWQEYYNRYIARSFEKTITGTTLNQISTVLQKISQLLVLWIGASMVLGGELSLGQLIAFRIISGYVTQPLLRLSGIWQRIQELRVSFERLGDVVDTPMESDGVDQSKVALPSVKGRIKFENVSFCFGPSKPDVLSHVNLEIQPGSFVAIVGQSGSGKSTLMKLLSRLYSPREGRVLIDGYDIDKVELYSLRRQIGIVPQDPLLFSGSVQDNIALTSPDARSEDVISAAEVACAHEFIMEMPDGYSSDVGERGAGLSGGQRQRVAIARTLLSRPKLVIMDEATSALDYENERRISENLRMSLQDCTVMYITHRLSTVKRADQIVMMHQGAVVEQGTHKQLMEAKGRYYALYRQQESE
uniref:ABC transporter transmembrane domain-containing protein n=1 Tax=Synechococcus sp. UW106 TaxID=368495 RepID=UPI001FCB5035|nr:ABC transporter transmembrane domain-containing protein [Synechococcus sp. UW106]